MTRKRLNLTVDPAVLERARRYSERHHTSISALVEDFLTHLPDDEDVEPLSPRVQRLLGVAEAGPDRTLYREHLLERYGE